jgi:hypothetical protein
VSGGRGTGPDALNGEENVDELSQSAPHLPCRDGASLTVIVEPWACEYEVVMGEECEVVALHPAILPTFGITPTEGGLIVWINEGGSTYEFWRNEALEDRMPIPDPGRPGHLKSPRPSR